MNCKGRREVCCVIIMVIGERYLYVNQAGLLVPGSSYSPHLPGLSQWFYLRLSSPDTAAGPPLILTRVPLGLTFIFKLSTPDVLIHIRYYTCLCQVFNLT